MRIIFSDEDIETGSNSIFLAGPTMRGKSYAESWRKTACDILQELEYDGYVYVPEFGHGPNPVNLDMQAGWERKGLMAAGAIFFYMNRYFPEVPGLSTNVELGLYLGKKPSHCIMCIPDGTDKNSYPEWIYRKEIEENHLDYPVFKDMKTGLQFSMALVRQHSEAYSVRKQMDSLARTNLCDLDRE